MLCYSQASLLDLSDRKFACVLCPMQPTTLNDAQLGGYAFIGEGIPIGLGAAFQSKYRRVSAARPPLLRASRVFCINQSLGMLSLQQPSELTSAGTCCAHCASSDGEESARCWMTQKSIKTQDVLGDEKADSVTASFFGDGTCNVGVFSSFSLPYIYTCMCL
jgi:hypothetical protein